MEVFHCEVDTKTKLPPWNGPCTSSSKPAILEPCKRVLAAWAMGALVTYFAIFFIHIIVILQKIN